MEGLVDKVRGLIKKIGIDNPPVPVEKIAELFSIKIVPYSKFPSNISGTIINDGSDIIIGVNDGQAENRQRFTVAHELGHFLMGHDHIQTQIIDDTFDQPIEKEREANKFAAELLMPTDFLEKDVKQKNAKTIPEWAERYHVSQQAMSVRLLETGLINKI